MLNSWLNYLGSSCNKKKLFLTLTLFSSSTPRVTTLQVEIPGISLSFALDLQPEAKMN